MNLKVLQKIDIVPAIINYAKNNKNILMLPDQDIISALYGDQVKLIDSLIYNLGERTLKFYNLSNPNDIKDLKWIKENTIIIHYYGRNKPWNKNYHGKLNIFYNNYKEV